MTDLKYENGLKEIRQQRGTVNSLDSPMLVLIGPMILTAVFAPPIAVLLCFVILYVYYSRLKRAAHHPVRSALNLLVRHRGLSWVLAQILVKTAV